MMNTNSTFWLTSEVVQDNLMKVTVRTQDVPENLFGVSFHLKFKDEDWSLDRSEVGTVFATEPMQLVKQDSDKLVVGVSLRRGDELRAADGELISFYVRADELGDIRFENGVASVYENGRKDLENVVWHGTDTEVFVAYEGGVQESEVFSSDHEKVEYVDPVLQMKSDGSEVVTTRGYQEGQVSVLREDSSLMDVYLFLGFVFFGMMIVFGGWLMVKYKHEIRSFFGEKRGL